MSEFQVNNSGNKERLGEMKHGVRREQLDAKFRSLFDQLDTNKNGTLELGELENNNADMVEFTQAVSRAAEEIEDSEEKINKDGSKEIVTYYKDGTKETIKYYPNGDYMMKTTEKRFLETKYYFNGAEISPEEYEKMLKNVAEIQAKKNAIDSKDAVKTSYMPIDVSSETIVHPGEIKYDHSIRYHFEKALTSFCKGVNKQELDKIKERFALLIAQYPEQDWLKNLESIKEVLAKNKLTANFDNVADALESLNIGMTIRNEEEWESSSQRREEIDLREFAKDLLAYVFEISGAMQQDYHDNLGLADFGFYPEQLSDLICKLGGESDYTRSAAQVARNFATFAEQSNNIPTLNDEVFNAEFEKLSGSKFNIEGLRQLKALVRKEGFDFQKDIYGKEFNTKLAQAFGSSLIESTQDNIDTISLLSGVGDIAIMLMTLGIVGETKVAQVFGKAAVQTFGKAGAKLSARAMALSNPVARGTMKFAGKVVSLGGGAMVGGTHLAGYTGAKETINNLTNPTRDALSVETWNRTADGMIQSFGFGAFGGIWGQTVTSRVMSAVNRTSSKTMSALAPKFAEGSVKGSDVLKVFLEKSAPGGVAKAMGFASEVIGFTAYESALNIFLHIEGEVTFDKAVEVLWEEFKNQGYTLGQIKLVAMLLMGSRAARLAESRAFESGGLKDVEVIPHPEKNEFLIKTPEGKMYVCKNENEMLSACMLLARTSTSRPAPLPQESTEAAKPETKVTESENPVADALAAREPKLKTEISEAQGSGIISISTEAGENAGNVNFNVITYPNGKKVLHFEGLVSQIDGAGVGSKLISELIKKSYELGAEGRIEATASPMRSVSGKLTNLGFYYKIGFRAVDPKVDAQIRECIDSGKEIPIALNYNVKLEYKITKPEIDKAVADIQGEFDEAACDKIVEELETLGFGDAMNMTHRAKSSQSLFDKIKNYMIEHPGATIEAAVKDVRDGFGARRIVKSANYARNTSGSMEERINQAIEMQSKPLYDAIIRNIDELANSKDGLAMIRMSNYATADGKFAYLTKTQYEKIRDYAAERGIDFKGNELVDPTDPKAGEATPFKDYKGGITKTQPSGYPAFQMNFMTKSGKVIEYQFRGDRIDIFAEGEHIPYDLRTGKDIIGQHPELEALYGPIKKKTYLGSFLCL